MTPATPITEAQARAARARCKTEPLGGWALQDIAALLAFYDAALPLLRELRDRRIGDVESISAATDGHDRPDPDLAALDALLPPEAP